jgi:hypothetical protein
VEHLNRRFSDVTADEEARACVDQLPEPRAAFANLGFRQLGFLGDNPIPGGAVWVHEVLMSPNGEALLTLAFCPPDPLRFRPRAIPTLTLHTALADGSLVVTTSCPEYLRFLHHPRAGSCLEGLPGAVPEDLWHRHEQRVEAFSQVRNSPVLRHDSMALRIKVADRCDAISVFAARWVVLSVALVWLSLGSSAIGLMNRFNVLFQPWFGMHLALIASSLVAMAAMLWTLRNQVVRGWLGGEWLARQFPWPKPRPFEHRASS